jgi:hypothetical protein
MNPNKVCAGAAPVGELDVDEVEAKLTASGSELCAGEHESTTRLDSMKVPRLD